MKVYSFDRNTREYIYEREARENPRSPGDFIIPANSTTIKPPEPEQNKKAIFSGEGWELIPDYRDQIFFSKENGTKCIIKELGFEPPKNYISEEPPKHFHKPKYKYNKWTETSLIFENVSVETKEDVLKIIYNKISNLGEQRAQTEKLISIEKNEPCPLWDEFILRRNELLELANNFIKDNGLDKD